MPVQHLLPCLEGVPARVADACRALRYNSLICVNVGYRGPVPDISWLYVPDPALGKTNRISFPSNYSRHAAPPGCSSVLAEITHQPGDEVASMTDDEVTGEVVGMLEAMGIQKRGEVVCTSVERQPYAYVVYDLDYSENTGIVRDYCTSAGIPLVGRFAQFEYLNMDGCIRSAMDFLSSYPRD
jgi:protoporphyrinogen oxidase